MAPRHCKDSVAAHVARMHREGREPHDGQIVECRWCVDGYGIYKSGVWEFRDRAIERINFDASPEQRTHRAERIRQILGTKFAAPIAKAQEDIE